MKSKILSLLLVIAASAPLARAQEEAAEATMTATPVAPGIYMLSGKGGNVGLFLGEDGPLLIDDELAELTPILRRTIEQLSPEPVRFVVNTHWHFDHVGGNAALGAGGAIIVAHDKVRERMLRGQFVPAFNLDIPPAAPVALPVITFDDGVTFHWNGETVEVSHPAPAHTDGDAVIYFRSANVVHMGDLYWNGIYPLIDVDSGGSMAGMIEGVEAVLAGIDDTTRIIPGHGPLSDRAELEAYHDMLQTVYDRVRALKWQGKTSAEVAAAKPTADFDDIWGDGIFTGDQWVGIVYSAI